MAVEVGTRIRQCFGLEQPPSRALTRSYSADKGLKPRVAPGVAITFVGAATSQAQATGGTFANFAVGQNLRINGSASNNGEYRVTATDASTQITLSPPPKAEGPISTVEIRTS